MNILIFIFACQFESPSVNSNPADDSTAQGDTQDTAHLSIVEDCEPSNLEFTNLSLLETKVPTVPQVQWEGSAAELHYIDGRGIERIIISQDVGGETQRALPMGLRANQTYNAQLVRKEDGTVVACSEPIALKTNALPAAFPEIDVSVYAKGDDGLIITNILSWDSSFLVAFDGDGEVVWALEEPNQIPEGNHFPVKNILFGFLSTKYPFLPLAEYRLLWTRRLFDLGGLGWKYAGSLASSRLKGWYDPTRQRLLCRASL